MYPEYSVEKHDVGRSFLKARKLVIQLFQLCACSVVCGTASFQWSSGGSAYATRSLRASRYARLGGSDGATVTSDIEPRLAVPSTQYHVRIKSIEMRCYLLSRHRIVERLLSASCFLRLTTNAQRTAWAVVCGLAL